MEKCLDKADREGQKTVKLLEEAGKESDKSLK